MSNDKPHAKGTSSNDALNLPAVPGPDPEPRLDLEATFAPEASFYRSGDVPARRIGRYRVLRLVGEGGMGSVYEAEQESPRRVVALKMIKPGFASIHLLRRFEQESQTLARLQHPGIAQIHEAGTADAGHGVQPYFAMEFVRGKPLDEHAAANGLGVRERLDLVARVCDAVEHAHQKGVIHRDLKPANILVDATGQPKILDFGVARVTDSDVHATMHTDVGQIIGTLPYMSPEQVDGDPTVLDTRSDVYALGVILYELLAGQLPHDVRKKQLPEAVRIIREDDPTRLSIVSRTFRGDVETVVSKALSKEKERRYQSAADLASDIRRYLKDEPIAARPPSTAYQLRKFAKRNQALVAGVAATFVVLVIGVIVSSWLAVRATRAEGLATLRLAETRKETAKAEAVNAFLQSMLSSADPSEMKGRDVTVRQVLDEAAKKVADRSLQQEPEVAAAIQTTLGTTYQALGLYREAEPHLRDALEKRRALLGPEHADTAASLANLASLLDDRGDAAGAESGYRESLRIRRKVLGSNHADVGGVLNDLALLIQRRGDLANAEPLFRESFAIRRSAGGEEDATLALRLNNLAGVLQRKGDLAGAEPLLRQALAIRRTVLGNGHPDVAQSLSNLGTLLQERGDLADAEPLYRESVAIRRKLLGDQHPDLAVSVNNLAMLLRSRGDLAGAEPLAREALAIWRTSLGDEHPTVANGFMNLGTVLMERGDLHGAEPLHRQALAIRIKAYGTDNLEVARSMNAVGQVLIEEGKLAEAESWLRKSLDTRRKRLPARHPDIATVQVALAVCLIREGRYADAETRLMEALSIREEKLRPGRWERDDTRSVMGEALAGQQKFADAEALLLPAYANLKDNDAVPAFRKRAAQERILRLYQRWGRPDKAAAWRASLVSRR